MTHQTTASIILISFSQQKHNFTRTSLFLLISITQRVTNFSFLYLSLFLLLFILFWFGSLLLSLSFSFQIFYYNLSYSLFSFSSSLKIILFLNICSHRQFLQFFFFFLSVSLSVLDILWLWLLQYFFLSLFTYQFQARTISFFIVLWPELLFFFILFFRYRIWWYNTRVLLINDTSPPPTQYSPATIKGFLISPFSYGQPHTCPELDIQEARPTRTFPYLPSPFLFPSHFYLPLIPNPIVSFNPLTETHFYSLLKGWLCSFGIGSGLPGPIITPVLLLSNEYSVIP